MFSIQRIEKMAKRLAQKPEDPEAGAFIGFDSSESDMSQEEVRIRLVFGNLKNNRKECLSIKKLKERNNFSSMLQNNNE